MIRNECWNDGRFVQLDNVNKIVQI